jgi:ubiquinone/menaquinone biosynthesis C-methylase UbiE
MNKSKVCSVEKSGLLDHKIRRIIQNPQKILKPYIKEGMTVLDIGCGVGFFTIEIAKMTGSSGKVIAADLQEGMLQILRNKIKGTPLEQIVVLHKCEENKIGLNEPVDFVLAFYFVHEVPDRDVLFKEIYSILKPGGKMFIVEPPLHVSKSEYKQMLKIIEYAGFKIISVPKLFLNKAILLMK